jgi:hypothetical protein
MRVNETSFRFKIIKSKEVHIKKIVSFWIVLLVTIVSAEAAKQPRSYYLTRSTFTGAHVLTACTSGYHTASLWEIYDTSNLRYNTTLGITVDDSGSGPPDGAGWIRTGYFSSGKASVIGQDNCFTWTSDSDQDFGTTAS